VKNQRQAACQGLDFAQVKRQSRRHQNGNEWSALRRLTQLQVDARQDSGCIQME